MSFRDFVLQLPCDETLLVGTLLQHLVLGFQRFSVLKRYHLIQELTRINKASSFFLSCSALTIHFIFMILKTFQVLLMPISFGLLFSLMLLYWGQAALFSYTKYSKLTKTIFLFCFLSLTLLLLCRFLDSGHLPLSNLYESLLFLSWSFLVIQFVLQSNSYTTNFSALSVVSKGPVNKDLLTSTPIANDKTDPGIVKTLLEDQFLHFVGVITSPMSLLTYSFAFLNLPKEMQKTTALVPALQSNWLMMHVTVMILSYAALLCGSVFSMAFLLLTFLEKRNYGKTLTKCDTQAQKNRFVDLNEPKFAFLPLQAFFDTKSQPSGSAVIDYKTKQSFDNVSQTKLRFVTERSSVKQTQMYEKENELIREDLLNSPLSLAEKLDNYSYRVLALGFPLLTVGILSGAVWANQAWGSYWSWDPKESWALITWLVFAIYLHARITKGWSGERPAFIASLGFFVVWFCYLGVNVLGAGLHSYGWFSK